MPKKHGIESEVNNSSLNSPSAHETDNIYIPQRKDCFKPTPEKYCAYCGKKLERKQYPNSHEDLSTFARRKYCGIECMRRDFVCKDSTNQSWKAAHATARKIVHLIEQREVVCAKCGSTKNVDIHHIDGVAQNNSSENLILLCRECHMKEHRSKPQICKVCGKEVKKLYNGMCNKHYMQWRRNGDPMHKPWSTYKEKKSKGPIEVYDTQGNLVNTYKDVRTAAKETGYPRSSICSACNGGQKTLRGFIWKYVS